MTGPGEHHFSRWFLFSNAYDSWHGLSGWFDEEGEIPPPSRTKERDDPARPASHGERDASRRL